MPKFHIGNLVITEQFMSLGAAIRDAVKIAYGESAYVEDFSDAEIIYTNGQFDANVARKVGYEVTDGVVKLVGAPQPVERKTYWESIALSGKALAELVQRELLLKK
jgi:hypothetical protein